MYKLLINSITKQADKVLRLLDNACIPFDPDNTDYQAYLLWCEQGNEPLPAENT
jgi:hypothetical protein